MTTLHVFIDESGNFDFSPRGTRHFILTAVSAVGCASLFSEYFELKHQLVAEASLERAEFHATEDLQAVRNRLFALLESHSSHRCFAVDSVIVQKNKANPAIREDVVFYPKMLKILLQHVFSKGALKDADRVVVWAAALGTRRKKGIFEKAVKSPHLIHQPRSRGSDHGSQVR